MKKVFITGGTGFIGRNLTDRLLKEGWRVTILARNKKNIKRHKNLKYIFSDIVSDKWIKDVGGADLIIHLAGIHGYIRMPFSQRLKVEVEGTNNVIAAVERNKSDLIYVNTAYGDQSTEYARAKGAAKKIVLREINRGLRAIVFCPVAVYGPGEDKNFSRLFNMASKGLFPFVGKGNMTLNLIYISDLVEGFLRVIKNRNSLMGKTLVICGFSPVPVSRVIDLYSKIKSKNVIKIYLPVAPMKAIGKVFSFLSDLGFPVPFDGDTVTTLLRNQKYATSNALSKIGYHPLIDLEEGIKRSI